VAGLRSALCRALEAEYAGRVGEYQAGGMAPDTVHARAFADVKVLGARALLDMQRRGLYPPTLPDVGELAATGTG